MLARLASACSGLLHDLGSVRPFAAGVEEGPFGSAALEIPERVVAQRSESCKVCSRRDLQGKSRSVEHRSSDLVRLAKRHDARGSVEADHPHLIHHSTVVSTTSSPMGA